MDRNKANSFCCGAGGGNMWYDIEDGERINSVRFQEAIDTGVDVVATACSFCTIMMPVILDAIMANMKHRVK